MGFNKEKTFFCTGMTEVLPFPVTEPLPFHHPFFFLHFPFSIPFSLSLFVMEVPFPFCDGNSNGHIPIPRYPGIAIPCVLSIAIPNTNTFFPSQQYPIPKAIPVYCLEIFEIFSHNVCFTVLFRNLR